MSATALSLDEARELFAGAREGADHGAYLSTCTRGLLPAPAREALESHLADLERGSVDKAALFQAMESTRSAFARLVGCDPDEVAFTKNVSEGLNMVAAAMAWRPGDNVVVCLDLEHPNNVYPWLNQRARAGIEVRRVAPRDGHVDASLVLEAMDSRTRLVTVPTVTFAPGFVTEMSRVSAACRERDVFLLADAVQSVGILDTDVDALGVDGLAVSTQKGLCGLYGMGFLYCRRSWAERLDPAYLARFGVDLGEGAHEATLGDVNYRLMPGARRFDLGNYNYPALLVAGASLDILNRVGTPVIEGHVRALARSLANGLLERGLPVAGGPAGPHTGSIVCIGTPGNGGHDSTDDPAIAEVSRRLEAAGVVHTIRRGMVRLALHLYNTADDVEKVFDAL